MTAAKEGDKVKVHYKGTFDDGTVFDSSLDSDPLEFTIGAGDLIPGFDHAVKGMKAGESRIVKIPAEEAYGLYYAEMVQTVPRSAFPEDVEPEVGQQFQVNQQECEDFVVRVTQVDDDNVVLDANHPLAGKDLTFDIRIVAIE